MSGSASRNSPGWNQYCADGVDFNTASSYLTVVPDGTFTALVSGYYRVNAWAISSVSNSAPVRLVVNGIERHFGYAYSGDMWIDNNMDLIWPMNEGDTFQVDFFNSGDNTSFAYYSGNANGKYSRLQISFVGPLQ